MTSVNSLVSRFEDNKVEGSAEEELSNQRNIEWGALGEFRSATLHCLLWKYFSVLTTSLAIWLCNLLCRVHVMIK